MAEKLPTPPTDSSSSSEANMKPQQNGMWFVEYQTEAVRSEFAVKSLSHNFNTKFQNVQLADTFQFGKALFLDGKIQSSQYDEFVYHECLVHPALLLHPNPKTVFIGGGGELATAREVLKHKSVEKVIMVDIDGEVVEIAKKDMLEWNEGVCDDPRLTVIYDDALGYIENYEGQFDVIIMDIADPVDAGPGYMLYTKEFYEFAIKKMTKGGVLVSQCGGGSIHLVKDCFSNIHCTMKSVFQYVSPYTVDIPSFCSSWAFTLAFNDGNAFDGKPLNAETFAGSDTATVDKLIKDRISGELKFYDGVAHRGIFGLGKHVRKALAEETRIITKDDPVFVY